MRGCLRHTVGPGFRCAPSGRLAADQSGATAWPDYV